MAHSYHHAVSSARRFGGEAADYQAVHDWFDSSKMIIADVRHRALRHHAEGCFRSSVRAHDHQRRGPDRAGSLDRRAAHHQDLGRIPSFADWVRNICPEPWMGRIGTKLDGSDPPLPNG